jgi:Calcineurin-like phosphoesterase
VVTAVISDLHLGTRTRGDLLRRPGIRRRLMAELERVDHLVLLGDSIELRDGPPADALTAAAPFFDDLGSAMAGRRVTVVAGNHDHQLASAWLERRRAGESGWPLGLEHLSRPNPGDPLARLARRMSAVELVLAYPGLWVRPDIYATHGHYLDCHNRVATFECLARAVSERLTPRPRRRYRTPDDYEVVLAPVYRTIYRVGQSRRAQRVAGAARAIVRAWESAAGYRGTQGRLSLRSRGLGAMAQVVDGLGIEARYVIFGHLHRAGPLGGDAQSWRTRSGTRLVNSGCWIYEPAYLRAAAAESPHLPGTCVLVRDEGPPELRRLLTRYELRAHVP